LGAHPAPQKTTTKCSEESPNLRGSNVAPEFFLPYFHNFLPLVYETLSKENLQWAPRSQKMGGKFHPNSDGVKEENSLPKKKIKPPQLSWKKGKF